VLDFLAGDLLTVDFLRASGPKSSPPWPVVDRPVTAFFAIRLAGAFFVARLAGAFFATCLTEAFFVAFVAVALFVAAFFVAVRRTTDVMGSPSTASSVPHR
jgi:hypothetical protein